MPLPLRFGRLFKGNLQKSIRYDSLFREFQKLKFDPDYVQGLLSKQRILPPIFEGMKVVTLGNPEAENTLIMVSNPTCSVCRRNHKALEKLLSTTTIFKVDIIIGASFDENDIAGKVARQILSLPIDQMPDALKQWFNQNENYYGEWSKKQGGDYRSNIATDQLNLHLHWLQLAGVIQTPTIFYNSVELPHFYRIQELTKLNNYLSNIGIGQFK